MATHRLGPGTCNLPINVDVAERDILGRLACDADVSMGALIRKYIRIGLAVEHPREAAAIDEIRRKRRALAMAAVFLGSLILSVFTYADSAQLGRARRTVRTVPQMHRRLEAAA